MAKIILESHDILGKLSVIKNALSLALEKHGQNKFLQIALKTNQDLIDIVKEAAQDGQDPNS